MTPSDASTLEELQSTHESEAKAMGSGWKMTVHAGSLPGDLSVAIQPIDPKLIDDEMAPRYYLYRVNPITGRYTLIQKS